MAKAGAMTDADLLGGDDDDTNIDGGDGEALDLLADTDDANDEVIGAADGKQTGKDDDDGIQIIIRDDDDAPLLADTEGDGGVVVDDRIGADFEGGEELLTDDEKKAWAPKIQKRIIRERQAKKLAIGRADALTLSERAAKVGERAARVSELEAKKVTAGLMAKFLETEIASLEVTMRAAIEEGKTDDQMKANKMLDEKRANLREVVQMKANLDAFVIPEIKETISVPELQAQWLGDNRWYNNPKFVAEANYTHQIDLALAAEKTLKPGTDEYYRELDKRVRAAMPQLAAKIKTNYGSGQPGKTRPASGGRPHVAPVIRMGGGGARRATTIELTKSDFAEMRKFGNPDHTTKDGRAFIKRWALEKRKGA